MATISAPTTRRRSDVINGARRQLKVLEDVGLVALFGAQARRFSDDLTAQRIEVEDVTAVCGRAVALLMQRGRGHDGLWLERRLSAVFDIHPGTGGDPEPVLYGSWVDGLDAASRG